VPADHCPRHSILESHWHLAFFSRFVVYDGYIVDVVARLMTFTLPADGCG